MRKLTIWGLGFGQVTLIGNWKRDDIWGIIDQLKAEFYFNLRSVDFHTTILL